MRHFPRLNRVASGILRRRYPRVLTLLGQMLAYSCARTGFPRDLNRCAPLPSIARPSHRLWVQSQPLCAGGPVPSQIMCVGNGPLLRVGPYIIVRRYR